jgi:hypothetical protein
MASAAQRARLRSTPWGTELRAANPMQLRVGKDYRLSGAAVQRALTRNTVLVVASAPGFPHGVVDHVEDIARVGAAMSFRRAWPLSEPRFVVALRRLPALCLASTPNTHARAHAPTAPLDA